MTVLSRLSQLMVVALTVFALSTEASGFNAIEATTPRKHVLNIQHHPVLHHSSHIYQLRYDSHEKNTEEADLRGRDQSKSRNFKREEARLLNDDDCHKDNAVDRNGSRYDHGWKIYVDYVHNTRSDSEFLVEIGIGTPSQSFLASIDTGSPLSWVYTDNCCFSHNHSAFQPQESSTFATRKLNKDGRPMKGKGDQDEQTYVIEYGIRKSGAIMTKLAFETVSLLPDTDHPLEVTEQTIALVVNITGAQRGKGRDLRGNNALLGLSPGNGSSVPGSLLTPLEQLIRRDLLSHPLFTVTFVKAESPSKQGHGGRMVIGGLDEERTVGEVMWVKSSSTIFWGFEFEQGGMLYNGVDIWPSEKNRRVILDTGSAALYLPKAVAATINQQITGAIFDRDSLRWMLPCQTGQPHYELLLDESARTQLFTISIGGRKFGVPLEDIVLYPLVPVTEASAGGRSNYCNSAIQIGSEHFAVLGNTFIKNHAVTFDYGSSDLKDRRIGIANRRDTGIIVDSKGNIIAKGSLQNPISLPSDSLD